MTPISDSPSLLSVALGECPAGLNEYREQRAKRTASLPSKPRDDGTTFHRVVEVAQRAAREGADVEATIDAAITELCASVDVATKVESWLAGGHLDLAHVAGFELAFGITPDWQVCNFKDPKRAGRCVIDRAEIAEDWDGAIICRVIDWKSGFSGWTLTQPEYYAAAMDAWLEVNHDNQYGQNVEIIECSVWTPALECYRDRRRYRRSNQVGLPYGEAATTEDCRAYITRARAYLQRLLKRPADEERPGSRCGYCDRRGQCAAYARLSEKLGPLNIETSEDAARLYQEWTGAKKRVSELERLLKTWSRTAGDITLPDGTIVGWRENPTEKIHMDLVYTSLLASVRDRLEEAFTLDGQAAHAAYQEAIETMAKRLPAGKMGLKATAIALHRGDKDAQRALMDEWVGRGDMRESWGVAKAPGVPMEGDDD